MTDLINKDRDIKDTIIRLQKACIEKIVEYAYGIEYGMKIYNEKAVDSQSKEYIMQKGALIECKEILKIIRKYDDTYQIYNKMGIDHG